MLLAIRRGFAISVSVILGIIGFVLIWATLASSTRAHALMNAQVAPVVAAVTAIPHRCDAIGPIGGQSDSGSTPGGVDWLASSGCLWGHVYLAGRLQPSATVTLGYVDSEGTVKETTTYITITTDDQESAYVLFPDALNARYGDTGTLTVTTAQGTKPVTQVVTFLPDVQSLAQEENIVISDANQTPPPSPRVLTASVAPQVAVDGQTIFFSATATGPAIVRYRWQSNPLLGDDGFDASSASGSFQYRAIDLPQGTHVISVSAQNIFGSWSPQVTTTLEVRSAPTATRQFALGEHHSCGLRAPDNQITGTVYCWGLNAHGELGDGSLRNSDIPVAVIGITDALTVAAGSGSTCAIVFSGDVKCWGRNDDGQLGDGTKDNFRKRPVTVIGMSGRAITLSVGSAGACAVTAAHEAWCWGANPLNPTQLPTQVVRIPGLPPNIVDVGVGFKHSCVLLGDDGSVLCRDANNTPITVQNVTSATLLAVGERWSCAVERTGDVKCWEWRLKPDETLITATKISKLSANAGRGDIDAISVGKYGNVCAHYQSQKGTVRCWGYNGLGGLGDGTFLSRMASDAPALPPLRLRRGVGAMILSATGAHGCANSRERGVVCWGLNDYGQLGDAVGLQRNVPVDVIGLTSLTTLALGENHSCGVMSSRVWCWGFPGWRGAGTDPTITGSSAIYSPTVFTPTSGSATALAIGQNLTCVLIDRSVRCTSNTKTPILGATQPETRTGLGSGVTALTAGVTHYCAVKDDAVWCWGRNESGQLGDGTTSDSLDISVSVVGLSGTAKSVVAGLNFTCALVDGSVYCWGDAVDGRLGNGESSSRAVTRPQKIDSLGSSVVAIAAGHDHACAILAGNRKQVRCWGNNTYGQIGPPGHVFTTPVDVIGLSGVSVLALGFKHSCAIVDDGRVKCWGDNQYGQLGDGSAVDHPTPVDVVNISGATMIAANGLHTCVIVNGAGKCWGWNGHSQLGNGFRTLHAAPQSASPPEWTFMIYLVGDSNDLYTGLRRAVGELDRLPASDRVNVVVQFVSKDMQVGSFTGTVRWLVQPNKRFDDLGSTVWQLPPTNSGDPQPLADFITWARTNYPAKQYYLAIADHGRGTSGIAWTEAYTFIQTDIIPTATISDYLTPAELKQALITGTASGGKLDIIHLDACLMSMAEVAYQLKDVAHYMVSSENLGWGTFNYRDYVQLLLNDNGALSARDLAVGIAKTYFDDAALATNGYARTVSVLDLDQAKPFAVALDAFANALSNTLPASAPSILAARNRSQLLDSQDYFTLTQADEYVDLFDFAHSITDASVQTSAAALMNMIASNLVVTELHASGTYSHSGAMSKLDGVHGVSIYLPSSRSQTSDFNRYTQGRLFTFTNESVWDDFLVQYMDVLGGSQANDQPVQRPDMPIAPCLYTGPLAVMCEKPTRAQLEQREKSELIDLIFALMDEVDVQRGEAARLQVQLDKMKTPTATMTTTNTASSP